MRVCYTPRFLLPRSQNYAEPTLQNMVLGKKIMGDLYVERIPMADIPEDEDKAAEYLHELYRKKVSSLPTLSTAL